MVIPNAVKRLCNSSLRAGSLNFFFNTPPVDLIAPTATFIKEPKCLKTQPTFRSFPSASIKVRSLGIKSPYPLINLRHFFSSSGNSFTRNSVNSSIRTGGLPSQLFCVSFQCKRFSIGLNS